MPEAQALAAELGGEARRTNAELAERADVAAALPQARPARGGGALDRGPRLRRWRRSSPRRPSRRSSAPTRDLPVYRFLPNIPAEVRQGVLCYAPGAPRRRGPRAGAARAVRPGGAGGDARRAADRARDGADELRARLLRAGGRGAGRTRACATASSPATPRRMAVETMAGTAGGAAPGTSSTLRGLRRRVTSPGRIDRARPRGARVRRACGRPSTTP